MNRARPAARRRGNSISRRTRRPAGPRQEIADRSLLSTMSLASPATPGLSPTRRGRARFERQRDFDRLGLIGHRSADPDAAPSWVRQRADSAAPPTDCPLDFTQVAAALKQKPVRLADLRQFSFVVGPLAVNRFSRGVGDALINKAGGQGREPLTLRPSKRFSRLPDTVRCRNVRHSWPANAPLISDVRKPMSDAGSITFSFAEKISLPLSRK